MVLSTVTLEPALTTVLAAFNCFTLTASVSSVPGATLTILLPPMLIGPFVILMELAPISIFGPVVVLEMDVIPFKSPSTFTL